VTVRIELAALDPGTTDEGAKAQARLVGRLAQVSAIALSKAPDVGVTLTVSLPELPVGTLIADGAAPRLRPEPLLLLAPQLSEAFTADDIWFVMLGFPTAST
jgi:hypothetical protein